MFLAKLFETSLLSDGWGVQLLQHVNYVTLHFFNKINLIKVVKVTLNYLNWTNIHGI